MIRFVKRRDPRVKAQREKSFREQALKEVERKKEAEQRKKEQQRMMMMNRLVQALSDQLFQERARLKMCFLCWWLSYLLYH